jgi:hypothetical protein
VTTSNNGQFWGLFLGAFFAFIFGLATDYLVKRRDRFKEHWNALVYLDRLLNNHIDAIGIAGTTGNTIVTILQSGALVGSRFVKFKEIDPILIKLANIELVNKYFSYNLSIGRFNEDFSMVDRALTRFEDAFLAGRAIDERSKSFIISSWNDILLGKLNDLRSDNLDLLARVRLAMEKQKNRGYIYEMFGNWKELNFSQEETDSEKSKIEAEISAIN